ncbi:caspase family protein [Undibacterium pigrum]|uniref:Caspase domain-containing protein n=1 Tax=Undibacterium pigrum TaxID=401470 RepID=A0A318JBF6_9BURK|nr:caspase family protein [Undibacterium pigrum]PXX45428.1 caspase domain-containing protein [Undibacterium pigrum]
MKLCLTIGVSKTQQLSSLPGAITVAHEMGDWARKSGFKTQVITDENKTPVTIVRIRETLLEMLPPNDEVDFFILHFAGHGFRSGAEQNVWLPSDWFEEMRAISVEGLKRQLYRHGIKNLSIFSDACRSLPSDIEAADIFGDPVLPRGPYDAVPPVIDRFNAVADGQQAYMLQGDDTAPSRCIFSTVLLEGLCGLKEEAFDTYQTDWVIPESLEFFSKKRLKEIGETYDLKCSPECATGNPRDHVVYFKRGSNSNGQPSLKWPAPSARNQVQDKPPEDLQPSLHEVKFSVSRRSFGNIWRHFDNPLTCNLVISGAVPKNIWSTAQIKKTSSDNDGGAYLVDCALGGAVQILVEFDDAVFASAVVYERLTTLMSRDKGGDISWSCVSEFPGFEELWGESFRAIKNLQTGNLSADQVDDIATHIREFKHVNPTLGAIASYLYDYTGDMDSIRRMAYFYCYHGQPMPFDVAFMGLLSIKFIGQSRTVADVPSVPARPQSPANDKLPDWVTKETMKSSGEVAGLWPWLRQGWQFMEDPEPQEEMAAEELRDVTNFLLPSQFSSFKEEGARILINKFHLKGSI